MIDVWREILRSLIEHDALLILGKGLGAFEVTARFLAIHAAPSSLVLLINAPKSVQTRLELRHRAEGCLRPTAVINNEYNSDERSELYNTGGVIAVTSRILAVDLLTDRVPAEKVTGIVVWDAHHVTETSSEAFILRLYRQRNRIGFIKGVSDSPENFSSGFFRVEKVMKSLYVKKLFLWPRFHTDVGAALTATNIDLVELKQSMSPRLAAVQRAIVEAMDSCLVEIRKSNKVDVTELTMEAALLTSFDAIIRRQLAPVWNKVGAKTKQLVEDLKTLRKLLGFVAEYDCVTFLDLLDNLRSSMLSDTGHPPFWMYLGAGRRLFDLAKERVFEVIDMAETEAESAASGKRKKGKGKGGGEGGGEVTYAGKRLCVNLEGNPKWDLLRDVLAEIQEARAQVAEEGGGEGKVKMKLGPTLVIARDERTASQARTRRRKRFS
jgi:DNA excision repair protein ERCC-4